MLAECEMRAGQADKAKELVNEVRKRYFSAGDWADVKDKPGRGFTAFDMDWMLSQWGVEFLNEGRRRRTDLASFRQIHARPVVVLRTCHGQWSTLSRQA